MDYFRHDRDASNFGQCALPSQDIFVYGTSANAALRSDISATETSSLANNQSSLESFDAPCLDSVPNKIYSSERLQQMWNGMPQNPSPVGEVFHLGPSLAETSYDGSDTVPLK